MSVMQNCFLRVFRVVRVQSSQRLEMLDADFAKDTEGL